MYKNIYIHTYTYIYIGAYDGSPGPSRGSDFGRNLGGSAPLLLAVIFDTRFDARAAAGWQQSVIAHGLKKEKRGGQVMSLRTV
jgi:hypothetical protein